MFGNIEYAFAWGHSQSGRLLNHFVHQNFNGDEKKRIVFDGIIANCPGAGKGEFQSKNADLDGLAKECGDLTSKRKTAYARFQVLAGLKD